jgi:hypothetical protein
MTSAVEGLGSEEIRAPLNPEAKTDPLNKITATTDIISKTDLAKARREAVQNGAFAIAFRSITERTAFSGRNKVLDPVPDKRYSANVRIRGTLTILRDPGCQGSRQELIDAFDTTDLGLRKHCHHHRHVEKRDSAPCMS